MRDQIKKEVDTDPLDGGIVVPPGGDGIQRIPVDPSGVPIDPEMPADDRAKMAAGIDIEATSEDEPEDEIIDASFIVKKGRKK